MTARYATCDSIYLLSLDDIRALANAVSDLDTVIRDKDHISRLHGILMQALGDDIGSVYDETDDETEKGETV